VAHNIDQLVVIDVGSPHGCCTLCRYLFQQSFI